MVIIRSIFSALGTGHQAKFRLWKALKKIWRTEEKIFYGYVSKVSRALLIHQVNISPTQKK